MNRHVGRGSAAPRCGNGSWRAPRRALCILLAGTASGMLSTGVQADNFAKVYYSARKDQLVVTIAYRGTNPDHAFSLKWGQCQELDGGGREVAAEVLIANGRTSAERFQKNYTVQFGRYSLPSSERHVEIGAPVLYHGANSSNSCRQTLVRSDRKAQRCHIRSAECPKLIRPRIRSRLKKY